MKKQRRKLSREDKIFHVINACIMLTVSVIILYPIYYIILASITDPTLVNSGKLLLIPGDFYLEGYKTAFRYKPLFTGFRNSVIYTVLGTVINLLLTIPGAYALSRKDMKGRNVVMFLFTFTMFFSGGMIPSYMLIKNLGFIDSLWSIVLPGAVSVYNLIVIKTFFQSNIPDELLEAAKMDGCSDFKFFSSVVLKVSGTIIAVMVLFYAVGQWNSYFNAIMYLNSRSRMPLQAVLRDLLIMNTVTNELPIDAKETVARMMRADQLKYCIVIISSVPMMVLYPLVQKHFTKGVMIGSIKG